MTDRIGGSRRKTRHLFSKHSRDRGKIKLSRMLAQYTIGDRVTLQAEPAIQHGCYHSRYHGRAGIITGKRGSCYTVRITDINKQKELILHPVHLRRE